MSFQDRAQHQIGQIDKEVRRVHQFRGSGHDLQP